VTKAFREVTIVVSYKYQSFLVHNQHII
jgi:hypothetical protein